jgi:threonine dehydrogenase-like Zn-dependent dehydrogenase
MKKLVLFDKQQLCYDDNASSPTLNSDDILLRVQYCGVCRTDAKMWVSGQRDLDLPRVLGHEFCGIDENNQIFLGWPGIACEVCQYCRSGHQNLCPNIQIIGFNRDGAMAELIAVPQTSLIALKQNYPAHLAIFAEPMACGINALNMLALNDNSMAQCHNVGNLEQTIVIFGGGTCGLLLGLAAKAFGLRPTIVENDPHKLAKATTFKRLTGIELVQQLTPKQKFSYAVNATASSKAFFAGIEALQPLGRLAFFSGLGQVKQPSATVLNRIHYQQLSLTGAYGCTRKQMSLALKIIERNQAIVEALIEDYITLSQVEAILPAVYAGSCLRYIIKTII